MSETICPDRDDGSLESALSAAAAALQQGDRDNALRLWAEVRDRFPTHPTAYQQAATMLTDAGDFEAAELILRDGQARVSTADRMLLAIQFAHVAYRRNDPLEAARRWEPVRAMFPHHPVGWVGGVESCCEGGEIPVAESLLNELADRFPQEHAIPMLRAILAEAGEDWRWAAVLWEFARERMPGNPVGFMRGARALQKAGEPDDAEPLLAEAAGLFPDHLELLVQWAELAAERRDWAAAVDRWASIRRLRPSAEIGYVNGAAALREAGRLAEAQSLMREAAILFPGQRPPQDKPIHHAKIRLDLARVLMAQDRLDEADAMLRQAVAECPDQFEIFAEYAAIATRRHDWPEALVRWREARRRFPDREEPGQKVFEAEFRVVEAEGAEPSPVQPGLAPGPPMVPNGPEQDMRDVLTRFESLGGTLHGCEFGLVQRSFGAEPLGLLRWTEMAPQNLIDALEARFAGTGEPENTILEVHDTDEGPEYFTTDPRFLMAMHTFVSPADISHEKMFIRCCRRLQFLRDKLIDDLHAGEKIFVYKITHGAMTPEQLDTLLAALRRYGDNTLLYVRRETAGKPHGTVELVKPGLMVGYIDRFSASPTGEVLGPATDSWGLICRNALGLWTASRALQDGKRAPAPAQARV